MSLAVVVMLATAACTSGGPAAPAATPLSAAPSARPSTAACRAMPVAVNEAQGTGDGVTLWALFFAELRRDTEIKVVWRMTGAGDLSMRATGPGGSTVTPVWGPEPHQDSTWRKPGDEWGTGWKFPTAGCWTVHAARSESGSGELALLIR